MTNQAPQQNPQTGKFDPQYFQQPTNVYPQAQQQVAQYQQPGVYPQPQYQQAPQTNQQYYPQQQYAQQYQPQMSIDPYEAQKRLRDLNYEQELKEMEERIPRAKSSTFGSIEYRPRHITFATQNDKEQVYLVVRRHWITNVGWFLRNSFLAFIPPVTLYLLALFNIETELVTARGIFLLLLAFYSLIITNFFAAFFDWYFDPYILTNERIIGYDFKPFTSYSISEATLDNIEDVREKSIGPIASIFNYGTIRILTASEKGEILFEAVPEPTEVRDIIADVSKIYKKYHLNNYDD